MSLPCTSKNTLRFLTLVKQKFDWLLFLCIICHGTFPVLWCLSHQVLDQNYFAAPKELNTFSLVTMLTLDGFGRQSETICYTLKIIWYIRKNMKLDFAINYACYWLLFVVSTLKQALKECKTFDFSVFAAISSAVAFKEGKWTMCRMKNQ